MDDFEDGGRRPLDKVRVDGLQKPSLLQKARRWVFPKSLKKGTQPC